MLLVGRCGRWLYVVYCSCFFYGLLVACTCLLFSVCFLLVRRLLCVACRLAFCCLLIVVLVFDVARCVFVVASRAVCVVDRC